jgi:hypothetical protein
MDRCSFGPGNAPIQDELLDGLRIGAIQASPPSTLSPADITDYVRFGISAAAAILSTIVPGKAVIAISALYPG